MILRLIQNFAHKILSIKFIVLFVRALDSRFAIAQLSHNFHDYLISL
jgi:hypothetical protein